MDCLEGQNEKLEIKTNIDIVENILKSKKNFLEI